METLNLLAQGTNPFGPVVPAVALGGTGAIPGLISAFVKTLMMGAAVYALFNFILAGYAYISSSGDSKGIQMATAKIWQTVIGITVAVGALVITAIVSQLLFGDAGFLLNIQIFTI